MEEEDEESGLAEQVASLGEEAGNLIGEMAPALGLVVLGTVSLHCLLRFIGGELCEELEEEGLGELWWPPASQAQLLWDQ